MTVDVPLFSLRGRAIVVTGGAGHLGRAICAGLRNFGATVLCLSSRIGNFDPPDPHALPGGSIESVVCDVMDEAAVAAALEAFANRCNGIDGLVNNAARAPRGIDFTMSASAVEEGMRGIFLHYFTCARAVLPLFRGGKGAIVNTASIWGVVSPDPRTYLDLGNDPSLIVPPAKAAVLQLTRYMAVVLGSKGVRVNALVPGWFPQRRGPDNPAYMEQVTSRIPMGRIGQPHEVVGGVIFLLSDASSYMTGQELRIDGGYTAW